MNLRPFLYGGLVAVATLAPVVFSAREKPSELEVLAQEAQQPQATHKMRFGDPAEVSNGTGSEYEVKVLAFNKVEVSGKVWTYDWDEKKRVPYSGSLDVKDYIWIGEPYSEGYKPIIPAQGKFEVVDGSFSFTALLKNDMPPHDITHYDREYRGRSSGFRAIFKGATPPPFYKKVSLPVHEHSQGKYPSSIAYGEPCVRKIYLGSEKECCLDLIKLGTGYKSSSDLGTTLIAIPMDVVEFDEEAAKKFVNEQCPALTIQVRDALSHAPLQANIQVKPRKDPQEEYENRVWSGKLDQVFFEDLRENAWSYVKGSNSSLGRIEQAVVIGKDDERPHKTWQFKRETEIEAAGVEIRILSGWEYKVKITHPQYHFVEKTVKLDSPKEMFANMVPLGQKIRVEGAEQEGSTLTED